MAKRGFFRRGLALALTVFLLGGCGAKQGTDSAGAEKTPEQMETEWIEETLADMTLEEKVGQMLMMDFRNLSDGTPMTELSEDAAEQIEEYHLGGVILFAENLDTAKQTKALTAQMQEAADLPLWIGIDEEGGIVSRLDKSNIPHEQIPSAALMEGDTAQAEEAGRTIGRELRELGVNVDFAPVADIYTNPENTVIGERAFGTDAQTVSDMASAFAAGLAEEGVLAAAKHFPGHGDTATDSHYGVAMAEQTLEELRTVEFVPFQRLIDEGIPFVMVGHITTPNATKDGLPASLSAETIGLLRQELGFDGIVITDAMNMGAITEAFSTGESAVMAVKAGVDMVLMPADLPAAYEGLLAAVSDGEITQKRLDESVRRILEAKYDAGLL
ncbi:glycoside hydrolase family 3 protein [Anaerotignum lactatifermentans]|uniref:beta-N-acetylhexosaminidase n=1 Tax=Anaerotignum lactatifermentans TaxID=160404 RepID=A0ABS2G573_9FIRM|nr:glycoside hydrolase family 3 protein [Anaerotignum lactatifermentans]MBM6828253.1 glycoside hydrolase family 3 protein [Anaerotignum lactatifermentans]MBM6876584.1 glycoside hydrolase family 3 protein [Anaerotignum lactatifermentans]MBM6949836.1 glycoside hydrolase family 3 protein [Anaerotignum lactatifermentans]